MTQQGNDSSLPSPNLRVKVYGGDCDSGASNPSGESHPVEKTTKSSGSLDLGIDGAGKSPRNGNLKGKPKSNEKKQTTCFILLYITNFTKKLHSFGF